jgi:nitronate monooxygenase
MFGCKYPIMQGGLGYLSRAELAAAVSNSGGLGIITTYGLGKIDEVRAEIKKARDLTDKPFGLNINLFPAQRPINNDEIVDLIVMEKIPYVETSGRSPEQYIKRLKEGNVKVIHKVPGRRFAIHAEKIGVDIVTVVGFEGGGHPGMEEVASMVLIPATVDAVKIPVLAAGGIADGRGLLSALALGASGVVIGTRFMATKECPVHPNFKEWMVRAKETDTMIIDRSIRSARRVMRNSTAERVLGMQQIDVSLEEQLALMGGEMSQKLWKEGNLNEGVISCGQCVGLINDIPTVKEFIDRIVNQALEIWEKLGRLMGRRLPIERSAS